MPDGCGDENNIENLGRKNKFHRKLGHRAMASNDLGY